MRRDLRAFAVSTALVASLAAPADGRTPTPPSPAELQRFAEARLGGEALRGRLAAFARDARSTPDLPPELRQRLRDERRTYFALRETLFELAFLHASAIVERRPVSDRATLLKASLALLAGAELVENFHGVAALIAVGPGLRAAWNEEDPAHGIPEWSWDVSLATYRNAEYQDLFSAAIARLTAQRAELDAHHARRDPAFLLIYPRGIEAGLGDAQRAYTLLRAGLAEDDLDLDFRELRALVERAKLMRWEWAAAGPAIREGIARDGGRVRGDVHVRVQAIKHDYLTAREPLYRLGFKHLSKLTRDDIPYPPDFRLRAISISLLAGITLYENARRIQTALVPIPGVRTLLNQPDPALGIPRNFWERTERELYRVEYRNYLDGGARLMEAAQPPAYSPDPEAEDALLTYVGRELTDVAAVGEIRGERPPKQIARVLHHYARQVSALGVGLPHEGQVQLSKGFGNLVGMVEFRKGKLFDQPRWTRFVRDRLKPGDILLEKTPFRLTDTFIPGHFGHVALYVGTEAELRDLGLLTHPFVAPHRKALAAGRTIVEALRDGTQINTLERFLNVDDLAILRPKPEAVPAADVTQAILLAFTHIGKKYDFAFDTNTWDTIVCSELAFQTYVRVAWNFAKVLNAYTISPDDVAALAGSDASRPFELVTFIHDARVAHDRPGGLDNEGRYRRLLGPRYPLRTGAAPGAPALAPPEGRAPR